MRLWITFVFLGFNVYTYGQNFEATINVGLNAAQIDGDQYSGYSKLGYHAGLGIGYPVSDGLFLLSGIYYDMLGSQKELQLGSTNPEEQQKIQLSYINLPLALQFRPISGSGWLNSVALQIGMKNGILIDKRIQDRDDDVLLSFFNKWNISAMIGIDYLVSEKVSLSIQLDESINFLFNNNKEPSINSNSLRNRWLTFNISKIL